MNSIPRSFILKGKRWKVIRRKKLNKDDTYLGLCDVYRRTIYLKLSLKGKDLEATFLHELFHAVVHEAHINPGVHWSEGVEEVVCDAFADVVTSLFTVKLKRIRVNKK